jgi:hypothetical protein
VEPILARGILPWPLVDVADLLAHQPSDWLEPFLRIAAHLGDADGTALATTLGRSISGTDASRRVRIVVRGRRVPPDTNETTVPFRWHTDGYGTVFPVLDGRFVIERLSDRETSIAIEGRVTPPDSLSDPAGRIIARRAAMATASRLLASLKTAVEELARSER